MYKPYSKEEIQKEIALTKRYYLDNYKREGNPQAVIEGLEDMQEHAITEAEKQLVYSLWDATPAREKPLPPIDWDKWHGPNSSMFQLLFGGLKK